ncbi:hypothetical protein DAEQUDRAFT_754474 [Daedalea quercina L-15889]|uniref:Uncharacterized protein n=1 Tax=Daedalea quercina L-15889 TaxID=1314783 RepID=A0A165TMK9_9APHY|nr:hypothetical protein DAEQUDRAFT_754474 [Daedalea quercina L-15889]
MSVATFYLVAESNGLPQDIKRGIQRLLLQESAPIPLLDACPPDFVIQPELPVVPPQDIVLGPLESPPAWLGGSTETAFSYVPHIIGFGLICCFGLPFFFRSASFILSYGFNWRALAHLPSAGPQQAVQPERQHVEDTQEANMSGPVFQMLNSFLLTPKLEGAQEPADARAVVRQTVILQELREQIKLLRRPRRRRED